LTVLATIINKIAAPLIGTLGMPARAQQAPAGSLDYGGLHGDPPVLLIQPFIVHGTSLQPSAFGQYFAESIALSLVIPDRSPIAAATPTQQAIALYLLSQAHDPAVPGLFPPDPAVAAAAARFAAESPAARTAWLTTHLAALRAGSLTPQDIP